jgi:RNA polymerase-binding transcription factor DksA
MAEVTNESVAAIEHTLDDIDGALARLRDGDYHRCKQCGDDIDEALLVSTPTRRTCARHPELSE